MLGALAAMAVVGAVALLPAGVVYALVGAQVGRHRLEFLAAAPPVSIGVLFVGAEVLGLLGIPLFPALPVLLVAGLAVGVLVHRGRAVPSSGADPSTDGERTRDGRVRERIAVVLLVVSMLVGGAVWAVALAGQPDAPPSRDGEYHGFFVKRIADTGAIDPAEVLVTDPVTEDRAAGFYPLGLHNMASMAHRLSGLDIGLLLTAFEVFFAAAALPSGLFVLVRRLVPAEPLAAGFTALITPFIAAFPYPAAASSNLTLVVGMSMAPATIVMVSRAADAVSRRWSHVTIGSVCVVGTAATHTSQIALMAVVVLLLQGEAVWGDRSDRDAVGRRLGNLAATAAFAAVLYLPGLLGLSTALSERSDFLLEPTSTLTAAVGSVATMAFAASTAQASMALLIGAGLWRAARNRVLTTWTLCLAAMVMIFLATSVEGGVLELLRPFTSPWYRSPWKSSFNVPLVASVFAGYALAGVVSVVERALRPRLHPRPRQLTAAGIVAGGLVFAAGPAVLRQPVDTLRDAWETNARTTGEMVAAFEFLAANAPSGTGVVLNEERDGSAWMYAMTGLQPLLGVYQYDESPTTADRLYLLSHISDYRTDPRVRELIERWDVGYVLVSDEGFVDEPPRLSREALLGSPGFEEVFSAGTAHVFRIDR